ncbi:Corrinoid adenosyltransferase [Sphingomonas antarctica]|uniref:cob(I)yrinic acid a,c-diamide adenosyltransferase n=1 Tax=Sphingomonas antarctica TaxID=2040274 RepID=UPI0039E86604
MVKLNKIYTRTGDDGTTGLVDGSRVAKSSAIMAAIGNVDEANSLIGVAAVHAEGHLRAQLTTIQNDMFDLGADIATPSGIEGALRIVQSQIDRLESEIDAWNAGLHPLTSFVLPGGSALAAALHVARAETRRAERALVAADVNAAPRAYINRLSDWLFTAARVANGNGADDILWVPGQSR